MKQSRKYHSSKLIAMGTAAFAVLLGAARPAAAFTRADADTAVNAYLQAFVRPNGTGTFIKGDQNGGDPGFWQEIEEIEGIEDANDRTGGAYKSQVAALLNGFSKAHGTVWSDNIYNDDISWAVIAYTRGYQATGNTAFRTIAKTNFDLMFARAWNPAKGALYWTTKNTSYNSCIECPAGIASYLLSQALETIPAIVTKAQNLFTWEKANLFNASIGRGVGCGEHVRQSGNLVQHLQPGHVCRPGQLPGGHRQRETGGGLYQGSSGKTHGEWVPDHAGVRRGGRQQLRPELHRPALDRQVHEGPPSSERLPALASGQCRHRLERPADLRQSLVVSVASANARRRPALVGLYQLRRGASSDAA